METRVPDHELLFNIASSQGGYFTARQAHDAGFSVRALQHHANTGRFRRIHRGVYRLRDYPTSPHDEVMAALMALGAGAVISHESALDLFGLSDVIPDVVHVTVPRSRRYVPRLPGVVVHTTSLPMAKTDVVVRDGIRVTSPVRTILDAAESGIGPEQIESAVRDAEQRGLLTLRQLTAAAEARPARVRRLIATSVERAR